MSDTELRAAIEAMRGSEDSIGRFDQDPRGYVLRLDDVLAILGLAHTWPPEPDGRARGICGDCGQFWPCQPANEAGAAWRKARAALARAEGETP